MDNTYIVIRYLVRNRKNKNWKVRFWVWVRTKILNFCSIFKSGWIRLRWGKKVKPQFEAKDILDSLEWLDEY